MIVTTCATAIGLGRRTRDGTIGPQGSRALGSTPKSGLPLSARTVSRSPTAGLPFTAKTINVHAEENTVYLSGTPHPTHEPPLEAATSQATHGVCDETNEIQIGETPLIPTRCPARQGTSTLD